VSEIHVGKRIREAREALGSTQQELARRAGISQRAVSYVEKQQWLKPALLRRYSEALGRPLSYFLRPYGGEADAPGLSRSEAIQQAFAVVCRDPELGFGSRPDEPLSLETKRDIVRLYERLKGIRLLPPEET